MRTYLNFKDLFVSVDLVELLKYGCVRRMPRRSSHVADLAVEQEVERHHGEKRHTGFEELTLRYLTEYEVHELKADLDQEAASHWAHEESAPERDLVEQEDARNFVWENCTMKREIYTN